MTPLKESPYHTRLCQHCRHLLILLLLTVSLFTACGQSETPVTSTVGMTATVTDFPTITPFPTETMPAITLTPSLTPIALQLPESAPTMTVSPVLIIPTDTPTPRPVPQDVVIEAPNATLPPGFSMTKYATLFRPTSLAVDSAGNLFATSFDGTVHVFPDRDRDGYADEDIQFSWGFNTPLGITFQPETGDVYVSSQGRISILRDTNQDFVADEAVNLVQGLPFGRHQNNNLKFGADGWLYMGVGSTCDVCVEEDERSATIMRFNVQSGAGEVFATGMRNPYDLAFHPVTGELFATDNGRDDLGFEEPREELNHIVAGADYGFPNCWDEGIGSGCEDTTTAIGFFEARSSADSLDFYTGDVFPTEYQNDLFVAVFGSFAKPDVETGIRHIELIPEGDSYRTEMSWFVQWDGMPLGFIAGKYGEFYVGDYINDVIYRISYGR